MHMKAPLSGEGTPENDAEAPGTGGPTPTTPATRSPSADLAEMDSIVSTQDDVVRRYVGLRDGLQVLEQEVTFIRNLNSAAGHRQLDQSRIELLSTDDEEDVDR